MNSNFILNIIRFIVLVLLQVLIFNNIKLFGYLNPFVYILFIILYPINSNKSLLLLLSFFLGLLLDSFSDTGGIHATACVLIAYIRPLFFRFSFGVSYEYQTIRVSEKVNSERISFILLMVFVHHLIIYLLELSRFGMLLDILLKTVLNTIFTSFICILSFYLIKPSRR